MSTWFIKLHTYLYVLFYFSIKFLSYFQRGSWTFLWGDVSIEMWSLPNKPQENRFAASVTRRVGVWLHPSWDSDTQEPVRNLTLLMGETRANRKGPSLLVPERKLLGKSWDLSISSVPFPIFILCTFRNLWVSQELKVISLKFSPLRFYFCHKKHLSDIFNSLDFLKERK